MASSLLITAANYVTPALLQGKTYGLTGWACNYPLNLAITINGFEATQGSNVVTCTDGFLSLLGADIQNSNTLYYPWLICDDGSIYEIRNVNSDTEAILTAPSVYTSAGAACAVLDFFGQPRVLNTFANDVSGGGFGVNGVVINSYLTSSSVDLPIAFRMEMGCDPVLLDVGSTGSTCGLNIIYES